MPGKQRANADAAATVGEHAGWRTVRNGCAARSVSMPARAIRTGVPDRRLFQAIQAAVELLDAKDTFAGQDLFQDAYCGLHRGTVHCECLGFETIELSP